jgi:hypothetical protein
MKVGISQQQKDYQWQWDCEEGEAADDAFVQEERNKQRRLGNDNACLLASSNP